MASDLELLDAWREGDASAGSTLFERHFPAVYRFFRNKLDGDVDDVVQQTFLACAQSKTSYRGHSSFRTFVFAIARNVLCDHFRARCRSREDLDFGSQSVADLGTSPSAFVASKREHRLLLHAMRLLPLDDQIALELYYWERLKGKALAEALGLKEATATARLARARRLLAERMATLVPSGIETTTDDLDQWAASVREYLAYEREATG